MMRTTRLTGMPAFTIVWFGQVVSMLGSAMSWFAFTIWAWQTTGEATALALVSFFSLGPTLLFGPFAGALVDRWNRKLTMMLSDLAVGLATVVVLLLYVTKSLQIWHVYVLGMLAGAFQAFQFPAYSVTVTMMLPKEQYARAEGMIGLATSASGIFGPMLAAVLLQPIGFAGIVLIDVITFLLAIGTLLLVDIPQPTITQAGRKGKGSIWKESVYGFRYIFERPSLLALQLLFAGSNLFNALGYTLITPMVLACTGDNEIALGSVQSAGAAGGAIGAMLLIVWGGPKRRIHGILIGWALAGLTGRLLMGLGGDLAIWISASFVSALFVPLINGSEQAIWQAKVEPDVQGRVFAIRRLISRATVPIGMLLAGPVADRVFEPAMMPGGTLAPAFEGLVGLGTGAGMALMLALAGALETTIVLSGFAFRSIRDIEALLPDHAAQAVSPVQKAGVEHDGL